MGLETIVFEAAGAGAMAALAGGPPATIRQGNVDAYIVGVHTQGVTATRFQVTCQQDKRWDAAGYSLPVMGNGVVAGIIQPYWLPKKVPIGRGLTVAVTQTGAGVGYCFVYVEYPDIGAKFNVRDPAKAAQDVAQMTDRLATAGGALTANTIALNSTSVTTFNQNVNYVPIGALVVTGGTGPEIAFGFSDPETNLIMFFFLPITATLSVRDANPLYLPEGLLKSPLTQGSVLNVHFVDAATDTPAVRILFAHDS
jgi:hypothetical protein